MARKPSDHQFWRCTIASLGISISRNNRVPEFKDPKLNTTELYGKNWMHVEQELYLE